MTTPSIRFYWRSFWPTNGIIWLLLSMAASRFASGVHYVHPDKPSEMWINEVGVAPSHQGRGIGKAIMRTLLQHAKDLGCREAWVLTDRSNPAAMGLYASTGGEEAVRHQVMFTFFLDRDNLNS